MANKILLLTLLGLLNIKVLAQLPGEKEGRVLLPNGWWLSPAGESIELDDFPLNGAISQIKNSWQ